MKKASWLHLWKATSSALASPSLRAFRLLPLLFIVACSGKVAVVSKICYDISDPSKTKYLEKVDPSKNDCVEKVDPSKTKYVEKVEGKPNETYCEIKHERIVFRDDHQATVEVTGFNPLNTTVRINAKTYDLFSNVPGPFEQVPSPAATQTQSEEFMLRTQGRAAIDTPRDFLALDQHYKEQVSDAEAIANDMKKLVNACQEFVDQIQSAQSLSEPITERYENSFKNRITDLHGSGNLRETSINQETAIRALRSYAELITTSLAEISRDLNENINAVKKLKTDGTLTGWEKQRLLADQPGTVTYIKNFESSDDFRSAGKAFNYASDENNLEKIREAERILVSLNTLNYSVTSALKSPKGADRMYFIVSLLDKSKSIIKTDTVPDGGLKVQGMDIDFSGGPFWSQLYDQGYFITQRTEIASVKQVNDAGEVENINKELAYSKFGEKTEDNYSLGVMAFAHGRFKGYRTIQPGFYLGIGAFFQDKARPVFSAGGSLHFIAFDQRFCLNAGYAWAQVKRLHPKYVLDAEYQNSFTEVPLEEERDSALLVSVSYNFNQGR